MLKKIFNTLGLVFVGLFLQLTLGEMISIQGIRPDFLLVVVILIGESKGKFQGELLGFLIGLVADGIGISMLFGLSALSKTIAGFISGFLRNKKSSMGVFYYYFIILTIILIHFIILFTIYYNSAQLELQYIVLRYVLPSSLYTFVVYVLVDNIYPRKNRVS
ncbi:MAG: rod shape-determining protein MreD [Candidatus Marinimicrobia bacterium]|nr:rod shape-determining protein MreD [Candidatus Neomarinimicrobiota bacterium]